MTLMVLRGLLLLLLRQWHCYRLLLNLPFLQSWVLQLLRSSVLQQLLLLVPMMLMMSDPSQQMLSCQRLLRLLQQHSLLGSLQPLL